MTAALIAGALVFAAPFVAGRIQTANRRKTIRRTSRWLGDAE